MTTVIHPESRKLELRPEDLVAGRPFSEEELDRLPYGAIRLDAQGVVRLYNRAEEDLSGQRREEVVGRHFFTEVAPCTGVPEFRGRFEEGVASGDLRAVFDFVFRFPGRHRRVRVRMLGEPGQGAWLFVTALDR